MKVLVTGCAGYVGSVLCGDLLADGHEVIGLDSFAYGNQRAVMGLLGHRRFHFATVDARDRESVRRLLHIPDAVVPLAALVGAPVCDRQPDAAEEVNHRAVAGLAADMSRHQLLVYPMTNSGYGTTDGAREVTEADPLEPISVYGRTKCAGERAVLDRGGVSLRLATVFGCSPRMRFDLMVNDWTARLCAARRDLDRGRPAEFGVFEPHYKRNFVHVRDVSRAFRWALGNPTMSGPYNLGLPAANLTKLELAHAVCDAIGVDRGVVRAADGRDPDQRNYVVSNDKILATGFRFEHDLARGIREVEQLVSLLSPADVAGMRNA